MTGAFTGVDERGGDCYIAYCHEVPGANGQGKTMDECRECLAEAIKLILQDCRLEGLAGVPER